MSHTLIVHIILQAVDCAWIGLISNYSIHTSNSNKYVQLCPNSNERIIACRYSALSRYRYLLSTVRMVEGTRCNCKWNTPLDSYGIHVSTGCPRGLSITTHDNLVHKPHFL